MISRRGLSRNTLEHHPLPDEVEDSLPQYLLHDLPEAASTCDSSEASDTCRRLRCPTDSTDDTTRSWSGIQSYTGTGISTERSSVFSWGYDEFDKAASRQVQRLFEEIDKELYEGQGGGRLQGLQDECELWASRFPHLRILGTQLVCPTDDGFQWFAATGKGSPADKEGKNKTSVELSVFGRKAALSRLCAETELPCSGEDRPGVLEAEGLVEEYLAFDCRDLDEEWVRQCPGDSRRHCILPPVSPYCCQRQAVLDLLFDDVWQELVGWMEELVRRHWEGCVSDEEKNMVSFSPLQTETNDSFLMLSPLPTVLPKLGQARVPQLTSALQPQSTRSRGSKHKSRRKSKKQRKPPASSRIPVGAPVTQCSLNDLIVIHGIPLQQRNLGALADKAHSEKDGEERISHRPGSSVVTTGKSRPRRPLEQSSSSLSRPLQSARRRNPPSRTLLPPVNSLSQSTAVGSMDEVVRGTRLVTAGDRQASSAMGLSRNTLLPPIVMSDAEATHSGHHPRPGQGQRQKGHANRAHSAITDMAGGSLPRDRLHLHDVFSRPNTTHTFRSDTPYRRSFTVLDNTGQGRPSRASMGTADSLGIGVTGISLGISSSSFLDSFAHHTFGHSTIEDEEEPAQQTPPAALLVPVSVPTRSHGRGGLSSRSSRAGL
ncbi:protein FAM149B1 isoform X3 [Scleropages formosus]|uniref:protein FAM149B1 isoform X3 n=1 Tax=Scleropages formosus TaxID=113540 RepID=UPI0008790C52|nr:protein FAM149B1 isoform X3 [Scleropages formosus]